jgi:hypothetical protein
MTDAVNAIVLASDIHLEFYGGTEPLPDVHRFVDVDRCPPGSVLVLAGDVGRPDAPHYDAFLRSCAAAFGRVVVVAGNHEYYVTPREAKSLRCQKRAVPTMTDRLVAMRAVCAAIPGVMFLERDALHLTPSLVVLGATLWSAVAPENDDAVAAAISDYSHIYDGRDQLLTPRASTARHAADCAWLRDELARLEADAAVRDVVVVTHHLPTPKLVDRTYRSQAALNEAFATDLTELAGTSTKLRMWLCGHTHRGATVATNGVLMACNPAGYPQADGALENRDYSPAFVLETALFARLGRARTVADDADIDAV